MLEKVAFKNFLALRDVEVNLEPFTVIVGPNACGKSTLLEGISRICEAKYNQAIQSESVFGEPVPLVEPLYSPPGFTIDQKTTGSVDDVSFSVLIKEEPRFVRFNFSLSERKWGFLDIGKREVPAELQHLFVEKFPNSIFLKLNSNQMSKASHSPELKPYLEPDGSGLATFCENMQEENPDAFLQIQESIRKIIPSVRRFRIKRENIDWTGWVNVSQELKPHQPNVIGKKLIFDFVNASDVPADFVSEGTLITLAILAATATASTNHIVLLDDIERGLHPRAIKDLISQLRALQQLNPGLQIVATTHSPYLLDYLEPQEIRVATMGDDGGMRIAPLTSHPEYERWKDAMAPGEFWSHVGESWVKNLAPEVPAAHD